MSRRGTIFRRCSACGWKKTAKKIMRCAACGVDGDRLKWGFQLDITAPGSDKRRRISKATFLRKEDAERALRRELTKQDGGAFSEEGDDLTFLEWANLWIDHCADRVEDHEIKQRTFEGYRQHIDRYVVGSTLANVTLRSLKRRHFRDFYKDIKKAHHLTPNSVHRIHSTIRASLSWAVVENVLGKNPATGTHTQPRKVGGVTPEPWTESELAAFLDHPFVRDDAHRGLWHLVAGTGVRRSEALALRWSDWDPQTRRISIQRALVKSVDRGLILNATKNWEGRMLTVSEQCAHEIERHRVSQTQHATWVARGGWEDNGLMFPTAHGDLVDPDAITRRWSRLVEATGSRWNRLHDLRHCHASHLIRGGATPVLVQKRMGHKTIEITLGTYGHLFAHDEESAIDDLANKLYGTGGAS